MKLIPLKQLVTISSGQGAPKNAADFSKTGTPFIRAGSLEKLLGGEPEESLELINEKTAKKYRLKLFPKNSVIFAKSGMSATKDRIYLLKKPAYIVNHLAVLIPFENVNPEFLLIALRKFKPSSLIKDFAYPSINQTEIGCHKIPIPETIMDQIRIATLLSRVEALIATRKDNLRLLDEFLKSTFLEMFGDPVRNEKGFEVRSLNEFYIDPKNGTKCGPFGSALKKNEYVKSGVPVWNMDNISKNGRLQPDVSLWITDDKFEELEKYSTIDGDVIISRAGTVGKMCVLKTDYPKSIISTNLIRVRFGKSLLPLYFVSLMTYCKGRVGKLRTGPDGTFTHMNTGILDKLHFPYPPLVLQKQFVPIVEKVESIKTLYQQNLNELENLYGALSQKAFKGELDLSRIPLEKVPEETVFNTTTEPTPPDQFAESGRYAQIGSR